MSQTVATPIFWSTRFARSYRRAGAVLQGYAEGAVHDFVNRWRADPKTVLHSYQRHAVVREAVEVEISGGCRMLVHFDGGRLTLLHVGGHEIIPQYDPGKFFIDRLAQDPAPPQFWPDGLGVRLFVRNPCRSVAAFGTEFQQDWLYYLSEQQFESVRDIVNVSEHVLAEEGSYCAFVVGGPGTGKTSVLLNLLKDFVDLEHDVNFVASDPVVAYIDACLPEIDVARFRAHLGSAPQTPGGIWPDVLLVDDPADEATILSALRLARDGAVRMVVLGFDPFQLHDMVTDQALEKWVAEFDVRLFPLDECYRQKANVGIQVKRVVDTITDSTPFLAQPKIGRFRSERAGLSELSNALSFPNPHGYVEIYESFTRENVTAEIARIRQGPTWAHWPYLLLVVDEKLSHLASNLTKLDARGVSVVHLHNVHQVKGVEFQHVFVAISGHEYQRLNAGAKGMGRRDYDQLRLLRIPVSRAKDSLVFFVEAEAN
jgi:hypothetical protein